MKNSFRFLRTIVEVLRLAIEESPLLTVATLTLRISSAVFPILRIWVAKLIIDAVSKSISLKYLDKRDILKLVVLEFLCVAVGELAQRMLNAADSLLNLALYNRLNLRIIERTAVIQLQELEDPEFHNRLERALRTTDGKLSILVTTQTVLQQLVSLAIYACSSILILPWIIPFLVLSVLPSYFGEAKLASAAYELAKSETGIRRRVDYYRFLATSNISAKEVRLFSLVGYLLEESGRLYDWLSDAAKKLLIKKEGLGLLLGLLPTFSYYILYLLILLEAASGKITIGMLVFLTASFANSRSLIVNIFHAFGTLAEQSFYFDDLLSFFNGYDVANKQTGEGLPVPIPLQQGIEFRNVSFHYPGTEELVLDGISFRLDLDRSVALVGVNGAGKTTLVKLLCRLYEPTSGTILLDNVDIREFDINDLRKHMGVIFQDFVRYDATASVNIAVGDISKRHDEDQIERASRQSMAIEVIRKLPFGFQQMLGKRFEQGIDLSTGQWQKIALGRAYMRDAQILILDEPSSSLDAQAEADIYERMRQVASGKISLLISHRFSTVRLAHQILVLDGGRIVETGIHAELVASNGLYARWFSLQASNYQN